MRNIIVKLQPFLPVKAYDKVSEYDEGSFDIVDADTDEEIGSYSLNEKGELIGFSLMCDEQPEGELRKEQISEIAQCFVDTFYPGQKEFELSGILDLDNPYMVTYEKRDEKYGIFLHSTGFTVSISTSGQVTRFYCSYDEEYEVRYSDIVVSEAEAIEKYLEGLDFEMNIQKFDQDVYKNGNNQYHLAYSVIEQIMDIPVDGSDTPSIHEGFSFETAIEKREMPTQDFYELIGLTSDYKLLDKQVEAGKRIEFWSRHDSVDGFSVDMDETDNLVIKLCFDEKTNVLLHVVSGEEHENEGEDIAIDRAKERALNLMFKVFPDTHERFKLEFLEDAEDDVEEYEDEDFADEDFEEDDYEEEVWDEYVEQEDGYTFYFHLHLEGIRVDQHVSLVTIGKYTGKVTNMNMDIPSEHLYNKLPTIPAITKKEAKEIYKKHLKMELMFIREYDEDGKSIYSLAYVPDFPETVGSVRAIDAISGKAMYVDVGDATFLQ
ncbi:YcdB/YcdC domain-containing protein [Fredinandcohnia sp. 179-A 10B2 NHS]|uniref:YcdB/YcdC domain-containing protein n=1 Tax=Fredinandcohnia sp. 179-A 10B2 NHS TaxID=3235176 RepID=UPI0039A382AB